MKIEVVASQILPAGFYYIGDPTYVISDRFSSFYEDKFGYEHGCYTGVDDDDEPFYYFSASTGGDGTFYGSDGSSYSVDSATIAIMTQNLLDEDSEDLDLARKYIFGVPMKVTTYSIDDHGYFMKIGALDGSYELTLGYGEEEEYDSE